MGIYFHERKFSIPDIVVSRLARSADAVNVSPLSEFPKMGIAN
jgi:hypothetical protein